MSKKKSIPQNDSYYRILAESSRDIIMTQDISGTIIYVNPAWTKVAGYTQEESLGKSVIDFVPASYNNDLERRRGQRKAGKVDVYIYEIDILSKVGKKIPVEIHSSPIIAGKEILLIIRDLRKQKDAEKTLLQSEAYHRSLFEDAPIPLWEEDFSEIKLYLSQLKEKGVSNFEKYFEENPEALVHCSNLVKINNVNKATLKLHKAPSKKKLLEGLGQIFGKESLNTFKEGVLAFIRNENSFFSEAITYTLDGEKIHHTIEWKFLPGYEKNWEKILVATQDISALKHAQSSLGISEASYENLFNSIDDAIYIQDKEGRFLNVNKGAAKLYDIPIDDFIGKTPAFLSAPQKNNLDDIAKKIDKAFSGEAQEFEFWGKRGDGEIFPKEVRIYKGDYFGEEVVITLAREITKQKNTEAALQRQLNELNILQATAFASTQATDKKKLLRQITNIIGNTLYPDNFGILLLDKETQMLQPHPSYQGISVEEVFKPSPLSRGITGRVASTGKSLCIGNVREFRGYQEFSSSTRAELCVPLKIGKEVLGVINAESSKEDFFTPDHERLLLVIAGQTVTALEKIRLFETEKKRRQISENLQGSTAVLTTMLNQEEAINLILKELSQVISFDSASVQLLKGDYLEIVGGRGILVLEQEKDRHFPYPSNNPNTKVIQRRLPLILKNASKEYPAFLEMPSIQSWMGVPLIARDDVIGILTLDSGKLNHFSEDDARLVKSFANHAAIAIQNAALFKAEKERREESDTLRESALAVTASLNLSEAVERILKQLSRLLPYDSASVQILENNELVIFSGHGWQHPDEVKGMRFSLNGGNPNTRVVKEKKILILGNAQKAHPPFRLPPHNHIHSWMGVPLIIRDKIVGMLAVDSKEKYHFTEESAQTAQVFAYQAAIAIENARLFHETGQRGKEFAEIYRVTQDLIAPQEMGDLLKTTLERAVLLLGVSCRDIYLYNKKTEALSPAITYGLPKDYAQKIERTVMVKGEGMAGHVAETLEVFRVDDYHTWSGKSPQYHDTSLTSVLGVPMLYAGNLIGVMNFYELSPSTHNFTEADERIMSLFATQAAGAVHSAKQFEELNNRLEELEAINQISTDLRGAENSKGILSVLMNEIKHSLNLDVCAIWLNDPKTKEIYRALGCGWITETKPTRQKNDVGLIGYIFQSGNTYTTQNLKDDSRIKPNEKEDFPKDWAGAWVPIHSTASIIGVIAIMAENPREFNQDDLRLLTTFAEMTGSAIQRARLHQHTEKQLKRLTTLRNIDTAISANFDLQTTLQLLINHTVLQLGVDEASILLAEPSSKNLKYFIGKGFKTNSFSNTFLQAGKGLPNNAISERRMQNIILPRKNKKCSRSKWFDKEGFRTYYCAPLIAKGDVVGVLEVFHREHLPVSPEWEDFLQALAGQAAIAIDNNYLLKNLELSNKELSHAYDTTLEGWGKALELRDEDTQDHTINVTELTLKLAREIGVSEEELIHIHRGSLLHDIGKMGIPDKILRKMGPLTKDEWKIMKKHPQFAHDMISKIPYLTSALDIPYSHHERWDGNGYPLGLEGEEIPLAARIFAVVDVWDALLSDRHYREAWEKKTVLDYIENESGTRFDPKVAEVFLKMVSEK